ncbi:MAG: sensor histidine kinase [Rhodocyclales bacterium]|nr:sensor histidine kinase [Rhodocyclales bacterium]
MDGIRARLDAVGDRQRARIGEINGEVARLRKESTIWLGLASGVSLVLAGVAANLLIVERRRRRRLEQRLREYGAQLAQAVAERTGELAQAHARLTEFTRGEERAVEAERRRLAREVHDQIGQVFTAIRLIVGSLPRAAFPPGQEAALAQALDLGIASARRVTAELRPPLLDDLGLAAALMHHADGIAAQSGIACRASLADEARLTPEQSLTLFRIVQEALTNALRHAGARNIAITGRALDHEYLLDIKDDGCGLGDTPSRPGALGLTGMRERAGLLGGHCDVANDAGGGVRVAVGLPLTKEAW